MQEVCNRLETIVKTHMYSKGSQSDNIGVVITSWGKLIRMNCDANNVHMIQGFNESGLKVLQKGITGVKNMVKVVQNTLVQAGGQFVENNFEFSSVKNMFKKNLTTLTQISKVSKFVNEYNYIKVKF